MSSRGRGTILFLIALVLVVLWAVRSNQTPVQPVFTDAPNPATQDAAFTARPTMTASATITDTPAVANQAVNQNGTRIDMTPFSPKAYVVRSAANARTCPDTQCESLGRLQPGEIIIVDAGGYGGDFQGSKVWVRTIYNQQIAYVHSSLVIEQSLVSQPGQVQSPAASPITNPLIYQCDGKDNLNCSDFASGGADDHLKACGYDEDRLDGDGDGDACEPGWN